MDLSLNNQNIKVKVSLTDTGLLNVLRQHPKVKRTSATAQGRKSEIIAQLDTALDSLTLTGLINDRHSLRFKLKPQTKSYINLLQFLLRELARNPKTSSPAKHSGKQAKSDQQIVLGQLKKYLESKIKEISSDTSAAASGLAEMVDIYSDDLEVVSRDNSSGDSSSSAGLGKSVETIKTAKRNFALSTPQGKGQRHFRILDEEEESPRHISGFLALEIEHDPVVSLETPETRAEKLKRLQESFKVISRQVNVLDNAAEIKLDLAMPDDLRAESQLLLHWGLSEVAQAERTLEQCWIDEEVSNAEICKLADGKYRIEKTVFPEKTGAYGLTVCAEIGEKAERVWVGGFESEDIEFRVDSLRPPTISQLGRDLIVDDFMLRSSVIKSLSSYESFVAKINGLQQQGYRGLSKVLFELSKHDAGLRRLLGDYYQRAIEDLQTGHSKVSLKRLKVFSSVLQNIGLGELVFVAPEGPHAIAGGLAQVVVGLSRSLSNSGLPCTIIAPFYEQSQGNKHTSAEKLLETGLDLLGVNVPLRELGEIKIPLGPTRVAGGDKPVTVRRNILARVYYAEQAGVRVYLLRHRRLADRLYAQTSDEDQVKRAVFLSRGALELMRDSKFQIKPHLVITNDWMSALVPVLLKTDPRYTKAETLRDVQSVHVLHNCGRDYQGRFYTNCFGVDLWPILGLEGQHYFGLADPLDGSQINFTAAAVFHAGRALMAVSKPYAEQLLTEDGSDGLASHFKAKRDRLFGVSNGINLSALRQLFCSLGENTSGKVKTPKLLDRHFETRLLSYKKSAKEAVQTRLGLNKDENAILVSLVGRLVEQKGITLLSAEMPGTNLSVMEFILKKYPEVQFLLAGPLSLADSSVKSFKDCVDILSKKYPGRVQGEYSFIPHREALQLTMASDIFLMPSRFEPGGITQLEAMACASVVVARKVGGLAATLSDYTADPKRGTAFMFEEYTGTALREAISRAVNVFKDQEKRGELLKRLLQADNDWSARTPKYLSVLQYAAGVFSSTRSYPHLQGREHLLNSARPA